MKPKKFLMNCEECGQRANCTEDPDEMMICPECEQKALDRNTEAKKRDNWFGSGPDSHRFWLPGQE